MMQNYGKHGSFANEQALKDPFENAPTGNVSSDFFSNARKSLATVSHPFAPHVLELLRQTEHFLTVTNPNKLDCFNDYIAQATGLLATLDSKSDEFKIFSHGLKYCCQVVKSKLDHHAKYHKDEMPAFKPHLDVLDAAVSKIDEITKPPQPK